ncbi:hypothetical protein [Burkholderia cenocepacia]|uniref:hypothetical protein n=1 Tax=Burkholderia cenocepacia TaxID=95486 RepID=UPI00209B4BB4|nr:hypothetical protein [Burkholderia cenocepacia]
MKVGRFTADNAALLLIDHQVGTMQLIKNIDQQLAANQSIALAKMAKILDLPVVITSSQEDRAQGPWSCPCNSGHADTVRLMTPHYA